MIYVLATIELIPGRREDFLRELLVNVPLVQAEEGCLEYAAAVDVPTSIPVQVAPRADVVTVVEKWTSLAALEAHLRAPHMLAYRERVKDYVRGVSLQVLSPAE